MEAKCSFSELQKSTCGEFRGSPYVVRKLLECKEDITSHLQSCHLSKLIGNVEENYLILLRVGKWPRYYFILPSTASNFDSLGCLLLICVVVGQKVPLQNFQEESIHDQVASNNMVSTKSTLLRCGVTVTLDSDLMMDVNTLYA